MNRGGSSEPCATERNEPMPSFSISLRPSTSTFSFIVRPSSSACSPSMVGVQWLPGRLAQLARQRDTGHDGRAALQALRHRGLVIARAQQRDLAPACCRCRRSAWCGDTHRPRRRRRPCQRFGVGRGHAARAGEPHGHVLAAQALELSQPLRQCGLDRARRAIAGHRHRHPRRFHARQLAEVERAAVVEREVTLLDGRLQRLRQRLSAGPLAACCRQPRAAAHRH